MQSLQETTGRTIPPVVKSVLWSYFNTHQDTVVLSLLRGVVKVRLGQLRVVFEAIAGSENSQF